MAPDIATQRLKTMIRRFQIGPVQGQADLGGVPDHLGDQVAAGDLQIAPIVARTRSTRWMACLAVAVFAMAKLRPIAATRITAQVRAAICDLRKGPCVDIA